MSSDSELKKSAIASMSMADLFMRRAEQLTIQEAKQVSDDPAFVEAAIKAMRAVAVNPRLLDKHKRTARGKVPTGSEYVKAVEADKKLGNGLPLECALFFWDLEMLQEQGDAGGFKDARIFQMGIVPRVENSKKTKEDDDQAHFAVNVNPQIDWSKLQTKPVDLRRYVQTAWGVHGLHMCESKARTLSTFPVVFEKMVQYLRDKAYPSTFVCLCGFNSVNSDWVGLQSEMKRHKLKWPEDLVVWLWDAGHLLHNLIAPKSKKWNLAYLYNKVFHGQSMPQAHEAFHDALHLRKICNTLWPTATWPNLDVCQMLSLLDKGVYCIYDRQLELARSQRATRSKATYEIQTLLPQELEAWQLGEQAIKKGLVPGLGEKHALRLKREHKAERWADLFEKYQDEKQFLEQIIRKGVIGNNMAERAEKKLVEYAKQYAVPRDKRRAREKKHTERKQQATQAQAEWSKERLLFVKEVERMHEKKTKATIVDVERYQRGRLTTLGSLLVKTKKE